MSNKKQLLFFSLLFSFISPSFSVITNCMKSDTTTCLYCNAGFSLNYSRKKCDTATITSCIYMDTIGRCLECECGYVVNSSGSKCTQLSNSIEGCRQADAYGQCARAKVFFSLLSSGEVGFNGGNNCAMKSNVWVTPDCVRCHEGYYLKDGLCLQLDDPTIYTNAYAATIYYDYSSNSLTFTCDQDWQALYSLQPVSFGSSIGCFPTVTFCLSYAFSTTGQYICILCDDTHVVSNGGLSCIQNLNAPDSCNQVDSNNLCLQCNSEDLIVSATGKCETRDIIIDDCKLQSGTSFICLQCNQSAYMTSNTVCDPRTKTNCGVFKLDSDDCLSCANVTLNYFDSGDCIARTVFANCISYDPNTDSCLKCSSNYYLSSGTTCTIRTTTNCLIGEPTADLCAQCYYDYLLKPDKTCQLSVIGKSCLAIDSTGKCSQCVTSFGVQQSGINCLDNFFNIPYCAVYTVGSASTCESCLNNFLLTTDKTKCLIPYGSCRNAQSQCNLFLGVGSTYEKYVCSTTAVSTANGRIMTFLLAQIYILCLLLF